jgi:hypothetical protein
MGMILSICGETFHRSGVGTIKANDSRLYSLIFLYDLHTKLFSNVIEGISNENAQSGWKLKQIILPG